MTEVTGEGTLKGRVAIVTGGAVRLGRAVVEALAGAGCRVCIHYGSSAAAAEEVVRGIKSAGGDAAAVGADLSRPAEAAETIMTFVRRRFGGASILINNAAIFEAGGLAATDPALWGRHQAINLEAPFFLAQEFVRVSAEQERADIVNILDWRAHRPDPLYMAYSISKAGLAAMTRGLAQALAPQVRVNAVAPGFILPPATDGGSAAPDLKGVLGTGGSVADISSAVIFLLRSNFVTGEVLNVSGGEHL